MNQMSYNARKQRAIEGQMDELIYSYQHEQQSNLDDKARHWWRHIKYLDEFWDRYCASNPDYTEQLVSERLADIYKFTDEDMYAIQMHLMQHSIILMITEQDRQYYSKMMKGLKDYD